MRMRMHMHMHMHMHVHIRSYLSIYPPPPATYLLYCGGRG